MDCTGFSQRQDDFQDDRVTYIYKAIVSVSSLYRISKQWFKLYAQLGLVAPTTARFYYL